MRVFVFDGAQGAAQALANQVREAVPRGGVLGIATGRSPLAVYQELEGFAIGMGMSGFALDEYVGVGSDSPSSFASYVRSKIEGPLGFAPSAIRVPNGLATNPNDEAAQFERELAQTRVNLQILGVGRNGHVAFNEPGSPPDSLTRVVQLSEETRSDNREDFGGPVPELAISQGIGTIMRSEQICLIATGKAKAFAISKLLQGEPDLSFPVTHLAAHPRLTLYIDRLAYSLSE